MRVNWKQQFLFQNGAPPTVDRYNLPFPGDDSQEFYFSSTVFGPNTVTWFQSAAIICHYTWMFDITTNRFNKEFEDWHLWYLNIIMTSLLSEVDYWSFEISWEGIYALGWTLIRKSHQGSFAANGASEQTECDIGRVNDPNTFWR